MIRRYSSVLILTSLICVLVALPAFAKKSKNEVHRVVNKAAIRIMDFAMPDENVYFQTSGGGEGITSLDNTGASPAGFGAVLGNTFYDYQNNSGSARQIKWGQSAGCPWTVHFSWMNLEQEEQVDRHVLYNGYEGSSGAFIGEKDLQNAGDYAGYTSLDVTADNRAVITCHNKFDGDDFYRIHTYWQFTCNIAFFPSNLRVTDALNNEGNDHLDGEFPEVIWPVVAVQDPTPANLNAADSADQIVHLIGSVFGGGGSDGSSFHYFQAVGRDGASVWTYGNAIDTTHNGEAYDLAASDDGTVAIVWVNVIPAEGDCDTCSQNESTGEFGRDRWDNDIFYQINRNFGNGYLGDKYIAGTNDWENRVNMTKYSGDGFRAFSDISAGIDPSGNLHVAYVAMIWDDEDYGTYQSRIFHWGENLDPLNIRTVATAQWDPDSCNTGPFNQNQNKLSMSFCAGKVYVLWVEGNSPDDILNPNHDDCAARAFDNDGVAAANGDIFMSVSADNGLTFDASRNLTQSYGGPTGAAEGACDPKEGGPGPCPAELYVTTAVYGTDYVVSLPAASNVFIVDAGYTGTDYIDLMYLDDPEPGAAYRQYGNWYNADLRWARVGCVEPVPAPGFALSQTSFKFPQWAKNCAELVVDIEVENTGNTPLSYTISKTEDGTANPGWLSFANFNGSVPSGGNNKETGQIILNVGGGIGCPAGVGNAAYETGRVTFDHDASRTIFDFEIELYIVDTVISIAWDNVATSCLKLTVASNGNAGKSGAGGLNMDYSEYGDWKPTASADVYVYDGSIVAGWEVDINETEKDTLVYYGMFNAGTGIATSNSLRPLGEVSTSDAGWANVTSTGDYTTPDTSLIFRTNWYAHKHADSCNFLIKETIVIAPDGATGVMLGEAVDFDVPSDSLSSYNTGSDSATTNGYEFVFMRGIEIPDWNDEEELEDGGWDADSRFGALGFIGVVHYNGDGNVIGVKGPNAYHGMYTQDNETFVYPFDNGFDNAFLYTNHSFTGFTHYGAGEDLHAGLTYVFDYDIAAGDTVYLYSAWGTVRGGHDIVRGDTDNDIVSVMTKAGQAFEDYLSHSCCALAGDFNHDTFLNIKDLTDHVKYQFKGGAAPPCFDEMDVNGDADLNIKDLTDRVKFTFKNGPALVCGATGTK